MRALIVTSTISISGCPITIFRTRIRSFSKRSTSQSDLIVIYDDSQVIFKEVCDKLALILHAFLNCEFFSGECFLQRIDKKDEHLKQISNSNYPHEVFFVAIPDCTPLDILIDNNGIDQLPNSRFMIKYNYLMENKKIRFIPWHYRAGLPILNDLWRRLPKNSTLAQSVLKRRW